jgi:NAD(P)-dependent dehydrogenase (short-subunit alcohol dehydrogenase family)
MMLLYGAILLAAIFYFLTPILSYINRIRTKNLNVILKDDVILLTGSAGGIGKSLTMKLLNYNPRGIVLIDIDNDGLSGQFEEISKFDNNRTYHIIHYDINGKKIDERKPPWGSQVGIEGASSNMKNSTTVILIQTDVTNINLFQNVHNLILPYFPYLPNSKPSQLNSPINILINNAGIIRPISLPSIYSTSSSLSRQASLSSQRIQPGTNTPVDSFTPLQSHLQESHQLQELMYNVNTHAPINLSHALIHAHSAPFITNTIAQSDEQLRTTLMKSKQSTQLQIITVASAASMSYSSQLSAYCGSKAAVVQSLRAIRFEHQRLLYDNLNPIKLPAVILEHAQSNSNCKNDNQVHANYPQNDKDCNFGQEFQLQAPNSSPDYPNQDNNTNQYYSNSPSYLYQPDGSHLSKMNALLHSVLLQIFPLFFNRPKLVPYTYKDHNVLIPSTPHVHWSTVMPWHIDTLMFNNIHASPLIKFLVPSLSQHDVADHIVDQIISKSIDSIYFGPHSTYSESILPKLLTLTPLFSLVPVWLSDLLVGFAGGWHAMDDWHDPRVRTNAKH